MAVREVLACVLAAGRVGCCGAAKTAAGRWAAVGRRKPQRGGGLRWGGEAAGGEAAGVSAGRARACYYTERFAFH